MARTKGIFPFTGTLEVASTAPLDARLLVKTKADLMLEDTWKNGNSIYLYNHIVVTVEDVEGQFMLTNYDPTTAPTAYQNEANWVRLDTNIFLTQEEYDLLGTDIKKDAIYIITNDKPELKIQGPFIARDGLLEEVDTIEDNNYYVFKVNNDYFFIYKDSLELSLPNDPSLYKQITGNFKILNTEQGKYEYCVPEVVDIESLDDIGMENLLRDTVIVDSFESYGSVAMNYSSIGFYSKENSESGYFYGFYVDSSSANISLNSNKSLTRYSQAGSNQFTYNFPNYLCTYQIDNTNILIQKCLNRNNQSFYHYAQEQFNRFKTDSNIEEVELIRKSNTIYDRELTAIGKKINLDLSNRLDFGAPSNIIVGRITKCYQRKLQQYSQVDSYKLLGVGINDVPTINNTNDVYWLNFRANYLVLVTRSDKIIPEPTNVVKLRVKNDLSILKYDASKKQHYFPVTIENIENFTDNDVSEFLSNIIVPATDGIDDSIDDGIDGNQIEIYKDFASNPYPYAGRLPEQDLTIQSSNVHTGLKIGKCNPDFTNTYEYRFSEKNSTFQATTGKQYNLCYSPIRVPGDVILRTTDYIIQSDIEPYIPEVISTGTYKRLVYNTTIGFNCPSYIIPSLYYYLQLDSPFDNRVIDSVELIAPSNCKYDLLIKSLEDEYNIDLSNRFSYDEGTISNYMLLYVKIKTMN